MTPFPPPRPPACPTTSSNTVPAARRPRRRVGGRAPKAALVVAVVATVVAGCSSGNGGGRPSGGGVAVALDGPTDAHQAPVLVALAAGFYGSAGVKVTLEPAGSPSTALDRVSTGQADLALAPGIAVARAVAGGSALEAVGALLDDAPTATAVLKSSTRTPVTPVTTRRSSRSGPTGAGRPHFRVEMRLSLD